MMLLLAPGQLQIKIKYTFKDKITEMEITKLQWFLSDFVFKCLCQEAVPVFTAWCSTYLKIETFWRAFSQKQGFQKHLFIFLN